MIKILLILVLAGFTLCSFPQNRSLEIFLSDSSMVHASVSLCVADAKSGAVVLEYNPEKSLTPASVMKLISSAAALELLGPHHTFSTILGYTGTINKRSGKLKGNIVIQGGGDPALGSEYFPNHYQDFPDKWISEIINLGIKKIEGRIISDDSYYDFLPVPAKWLWEDTGNYYGAGAYGISVFDNKYEIHFKTSSDSTSPIITGIVPDECRYELTNWLISEGTSDKGYVFAAPYSKDGWLTGSVPANMDDFVLKASITDPPLLLAKIINETLKSKGITVSGEPTTYRLDQKYHSAEITSIAEIVSPELHDIIEVLNHESVNLYAEHLVKELGKYFKKDGSTASGIEVIIDFLHNANVNTEGIFMADGSGLSPLDALNTRELVGLLYYMKSMGKYFPEYYNSLPDAGKEGTLKYYFNDPVFDSRLKAKSGSMTRVRCYAGYFTTVTGNEMIFSILVNNYTGSSQRIISGIENIIREIILYK